MWKENVNNFTSLPGSPFPALVVIDLERLGRTKIYSIIRDFQISLINMELYNAHESETSQCIRHSLPRSLDRIQIHYC